MTTPQPIRPEQHSQETPHGALVNALQIADMGSDLLFGGHRHDEVGTAFTDVGRLIRDALSGLGEPHPHTVELTRRYLEALSGKDVTDREARDFAMVVINSALRWEAP